MTKGIDISQWQGYNVDFKKVKAAGYDFVILRAGFGKYASQKDPTFETNYTRAKAAGLGVGAYWYSYATASADASKEAAVFLSVIKGKTFEFPLAFDIEDPSQANLSGAILGNICKSFCDTVERAGYYVCLYSYPGFMARIPAEVVSKYDVWIANFTTAAKPYYNGPYGIWQHSSTGRVNGVTGDVDLDIAYKDYPSIMKSNGLNGFEKIKIEAAKTVDAPKKGSGDVNGDGKVNAADVTITAAYVKGKKPLTSDQKKRADVNGDGKVNAADVTGIANMMKHADKWITYVVKKGDTLYDISKKYGVSIVEIAKDNNIKNVNLIYASQKLRIKVK
jgi:GH25 family lysozyme M1 (1,4-beta-N-acetylmuramidase)